MATTGCLILPRPRTSAASAGAGWHPATPGTPAARYELDERAACVFDPELHTGPDAARGESPAERAAREHVAKEVCIVECPVRALCLARALRLRPASGVWAGMTAGELGELAPISGRARAVRLPRVA